MKTGQLQLPFGPECRFEICCCARIKRVYLQRSFSSIPPMNESQRKAYLSAMGIDVYYPRVNIPGAKISPLYEFDLEEAGQAPVDDAAMPEIKEQATDLPPEPKIINEGIKKAKEEIGKQSRAKREEDAVSEVVPVETEAKSAASSTANESDAAPLRFALRYYRITDSLAVIEEYPLQQSKDSNKESLNLLRNILRALTIQTEEPVFTPEHFNWPLLDGLAEDADEATAARQALLGFIAGRQQQDGFKNLLVFTGFIDDLLIGPDGVENRRDYTQAGTNYSITLTHSLQSMLSYPQLKKDVWQQLQSLLGRIQAEN